MMPPPDKLLPLAWRNASARYLAYCACLLFASAVPPPLSGRPVAASPQAKAAPRHIVSLNLCADQYLLAVADRRQIAALTPNADNREMSAAAAQVGGLRMLGQSAEEMLDIQPDLVIGMPARGSPVMEALADQHYPMLDLRTEQSWKDIATQIRQVAAATGHPARGEALVRRMEGELARLPRPGRGRVAAHYQRRGFLTGSGTLVDDLMRRAGLVNLADRLDKPPLSRLSIEELVAARPDFIIVDTMTDRISDQGTEMLHHPALRNIPRIRLPEAWTVCGSPAYVDAARSLVAQITRFSRP